MTEDLNQGESPTAFKLVLGESLQCGHDLSWVQLGLLKQMDPVLEKVVSAAVPEGVKGKEPSTRLHSSSVFPVLE